MGVILFVLGLILIFFGWANFSEAKRIEKETKQRELNIHNMLQSLTNNERDLERREEKAKRTEDRLVDITKALKNEIAELKAEAKNLYDESLANVYESVLLENIDEITSSEIKNNLSMLKIKEKEMLVNIAVILPEHKTEREKNSLRKKILIPFEAEFAGLINKLTIANIDSTRDKIIRSFDKVNKLFQNDDISLSKKFLELKLKELELHYSYIVRLNDEKEQQKAIKEQMVEEEKVKREIDREKKRIDKEERQFNNEINKLTKYLSKASDDIEKNLYIDKIRELESKLKELEEVKKDVLQRELNTRAGYVYVISNIGSLGENIYKIGMTRRLEPLDRIKELSSASVPFEFDVHAMIFSEDAPKLENNLHQHFKDKEVNKVNHRKEFFNVDINEIEKVVLENYNGTVTFTKVAKAEQYRRTLELIEQNNN